MTVRDPYNAFCRHTHVALDGAAAGPLHGLTFAAKDVFDVAGHRTGNGNPVWLESHPPAARTAAVIDRLLAAGASTVGKTPMVG
jgi:amidase